MELLISFGIAAVATCVIAATLWALSTLFIWLSTYDAEWVIPIIFMLAVLTFVVHGVRLSIEKTKHVPTQVEATR